MLMNSRRALRVAIREVKDAIAAVAFDANAYVRYGARYPQAIRAYKRTRELRAALEELRGMLKQGERVEGSTHAEQN